MNILSDIDIRICHHWSTELFVHDLIIASLYVELCKGEYCKPFFYILTVLRRSLKIENCFHLAQSFSPQDILEDHVCKVQCAFAFRAFPTVRTGDNHIGFS